MINEVRSKTGWRIIALTIFMTGASCWVFYLLWLLTFRDEEPAPFDMYLFACTLGSIALTSVIYVFSESKKIIITNDGFSIKYLFRKESFSYKNENLVGFHYIDHGVRRYLYFKTSDGGTFVFNNIEFGNFNELKSGMLAKSNQAKVDTLFDYKHYFKCLLTAIAVVLGVTFLFLGIQPIYK